MFEIIRSTRRRVRREFPRLLETPESFINKFHTEYPIWHGEWDICCILDGCRQDTFNAVYSTGGDCESIRSVASTSQTWIPRTFNTVNTSDVAYITANPFASRLNPRDFAYFHIEEVKQTKYNIETVPPIDLADHVIDVWRQKEKHGINRIVVHFMQPHVPFRAQPELFEEFHGSNTWGSRVWHYLHTKDISKSEFLNWYQDNLLWVINEGVGPILSNADAEVCLSSDHGNAAGEWGYYGHPRRCPISAVRTVPWHKVQAEDNRERFPEIQSVNHEINTDSQLSALGYK